MDEIQRQLHRQLQTGERLAIGWGVSGYVEYQLRFSPYPFQYLVDGGGQLAGTELHGVPVISAQQLAALDPTRYVVVVLAEWARFGQEICLQAQALGFTVIPPSVASELADEFPKRQLDILFNQLAADNPPSVRNEHVAVLYIQNLVKGGAERQIVLLAQGLTELGYQVHLVCQSPDHPATLGWQQQLQELNVIRHLFEHPKVIWMDQPPSENELTTLQRLSPYVRVRGLHNILCMHRILKKVEPDLFVSYLDDCNLSSAVAGIWSGQHSTLLSCRNLQPDTDGYARLNDFYITPVSALRQWYSIFCRSTRLKIYHNSIEGKHSYESWLGFKTNQIVIENATQLSAVEIKRIKSFYKIPNNTKIIVAVMRLSSEKNPIGFVKLMSELSKSLDNVVGFLIGDGPLMAEVISQRTKLNLENSLIVTGFVENVNSFLAEADLCVVPSFQEGSSNIVLEALTAGCPTVAYSVGGIKSLMSGEITEYLVPPKRADLLYKKCLFVLSSDSEKNKFIKYSKKIKEKYNLSALANKTINLSKTEA